jgi:uncharacterized protein
LFIGILSYSDSLTSETIYNEYVYYNFTSDEDFQYAKLILPAVDDAGNGVATDLIVEIKQGTGRTLSNIDKLLFWVDTQQSIQIAKDVAKEITGINTDNIDIIYSINAGGAALVGGPSAGAALTIATIAALQNKQINEDIIITGTMNPDGTIGQVGGILEKAIASKEIGANLFLVPYGEGNVRDVKPIEDCRVEESIGRRMEWCTVTYEISDTSIGEEAGIEVKEVKNIEEALEYFI